MDVIPVLDVARGQVVRARAGKRESYAPLVTPFARTSQPADVALGLARLHSFRKYYIADLDGIEGRGRNVHLVPTLSQVMRRVELWVDAGTGSRGAARAVLAAPVTTLVIGSESLETVGELVEMQREAQHRTVLSLDFRGDDFMGPHHLLDDASCWPERVIVMTLERIGGNSGPDIARLKSIIEMAGKRRVFAAGGVRDRGDLEALRDAGAAGVLLASALHDKKITADDLNEITGREVRHSNSEVTVNR